MPTQVSDFSVVLDGDRTIQPGVGLDASFGTGGRISGPKNAILLVNLRSLDEPADVVVKVNQQQVGMLYNYFDEDVRNWQSQQFVFNADALNDGVNHLEIDVASGSMRVKDIEDYASVPRTLKGVAVGDLSDAMLCRR